MHLRFMTTLALSFLLLFISPVAGRYAHRRPIHRHVARADPSVSPTETPVLISAPLTPSDAVAEDILKIQEGFENLPKDLLGFILALEKRLQEVEALLQALGGDGSSSPVAPVGPVFRASTSSSYSIEDLTTADPATIFTSTSTSAVRLCKNGGAGPLVPCDEPYRTTHTSHLTLTSTVPWTVTQHMPIPTGALNNASHSRANSTAFISPAAWTAPYVYTRSSSTHKAVAYTVSYAPESSLPTITSAFTISDPFPTSESAALSGVSSTVLYEPLPTSSSYTFDPESEDNVAVYYGTTPATTTSGLLELCQNPNVDIILLSFVYDFFSANGYPSMSLGPGCAAPNAAQESQAPGLKDCTILAPSITACQKTYGKKILLSLGGYIANTTFTSDDQASTFATTLWSLFGPSTPDTNPLRPFGDSVTAPVLDGFDIDNESHTTAYYETFARALRRHYAEDPSKRYYTSAAPQCPIPDESIPSGALALTDFVWVQFYNNLSCNLDSEGFASSFAAWSALLANTSSENTFTSPSTPTSPYPDPSLPLARGPKVFVGTGAWSGAGSGYVVGSGLATRVSLAREQGVENLGGMMLWDGLEGAENVDQVGVSYLKYAKEALH